MNAFFAILAIAGSLSSAKAWGITKDPLQSPGLAQDVISTVDNPIAVDWRSADIEWSLGYGAFDERNNFENEVFELGIGFPQSSGQILRMNLRRVNVYSTRNSHDMGRTPFVQEAGVTRYEIGAAFLYGILEGRQITRLSPYIPDVESAVFLVAGGHYAHPSPTALPKRSRVIEPKPGRQAIGNRLNFEVGFEWQLYLPSDVGMRVGYYMHRLIPAGDDLGWTPLLMSGFVWDMR